MNNSLESRIATLESRDIRVEQDKKWEASTTRIISILFMTYIVIGGYLYLLYVEKWYLHALVPTYGFYLSTLALLLVRRM